jgi:CspA family cold shock protein
MPIGKVRHWNPDRGYGFIECDDGTGDVFVHIRDVRANVDALEIGQRVKFEVGNDRTGRPRATNVTSL